MSTYVETWEMTECPDGHQEMRTKPIRGQNAMAHCARCGLLLSPLWERDVEIGIVTGRPLVEVLVGPA